MRRRTVVTALGASVIPFAGCTGDVTLENNTTDTDLSPSDTPGTKTNRTTTLSPGEEPMDSGIPRTVTLDGQSDTDLRDAFGIAGHVSVLESSVTPQHTARVRVTLENSTAQSRSLTYTRDTCDLNLITGTYQQDEGIHLLLVSTEQEWDRTDEDCWVPDGRNLNCGIPAVDHEITIAPEEPFHWTFRLWADPKNSLKDVCMPLGTYQFDRAFRHEGARASLSFTLAIGE